MKTLNKKIQLANNLIEVQKKLIAHCYKVDKTIYSDRQLKRFGRLENDMLEATIEYKNAICTCDYGYVGRSYCPIHVKTEP